MVSWNDIKNLEDGAIVQVMGNRTEDLRRKVQRKNSSM